MITRTKIADLLAGDDVDISVCVRGWVRTKRGSKNFSFINLNDGSTQAGIQIIVDGNLENYEEIAHLNTGASLEAQGTLVNSPGKGQKYEIQASSIKVYGNASGEDYPLQKKGHTLEFLREIAHLRPRTNTLGCVFRIRNGVSYAIHKFFQERGFVLVHSPIITASDAEGSGEMFRVSALNPLELPKAESGAIDYSNDFFGKPVYLTVSGQLEAEIFATSLSDVYTFGPTFRAENSNTSRHLAEFWMIEPEMAFYDLNDNAQLAEKFLRYLIQYCLDNYRDDLQFLQKLYTKDLIPTLEKIANSQFKKITYTEAIDILIDSKKKFEFMPEWGVDLQSEHERFLTENHFKKPVIVVDYPKEIKAFYMRQNDDGKTVAAMDVLFPKIGEIIGGSQREERLDYLEKKIEEEGMNKEDYWWYLDLRRFGSVPHSGFGLGFERMVQFITGMSNIRDVIPFPRVPNNAEF